MTALLTLSHIFTHQVFSLLLYSGRVCFKLVILKNGKFNFHYLLRYHFYDSYYKS